MFSNLVYDEKTEKSYTHTHISEYEISFSDNLSNRAPFILINQQRQ